MQLEKVGQTLSSSWLSCSRNNSKNLIMVFSLLENSPDKFLFTGVIGSIGARVAAREFDRSN